MSDHVQQTIADLQVKLGEQEAAAIKTKRLINTLCEVANIPLLYQDSELESGGGIALSIQGDQFYGQPLSTCIRNVLEMRRTLKQGPATVNEIHSALVQGNFQFDTKTEDNAKRNLRISLTKNTAIFHKLPNGKFGLLEWYPNVKPSRQRAGEPEAESEEESADAE